MTSKTFKLQVPNLKFPKIDDHSDFVIIGVVRECPTKIKSEKKTLKLVSKWLRLAGRRHAVMSEIFGAWGGRRTPSHATCVVWSSSHSPKKDATRTNHQDLQYPPLFFDIIFSVLVFFLVRFLLLSLPFEVVWSSSHSPASKHDPVLPVPQ